MPFTPKDWVDQSVALTTPITAAALEDLETRVTDYTDSEISEIPGGAGGGVANMYDVVADHGAVGDGVADDTAAIQAAFDYARNNGGVAYFPVGEYRVTETLNLGNGGAQPHPYRIEGASRGKSTTLTARGSTIWWDPPTPVGSGFCIDFDEASGIEMAHLNFKYTGGCDGDLIAVQGGPADCVNIFLNDLTFADSVEGGGGRTMRSMIYLFRTINCVIEKSVIGGGMTAGIYFGNGLFNVGTHVRNNTFHNNTGPHIFLGNPDGENIVIESNIFEVSQAIKGALVADGDVNSNSQRSLVIRNNWFGDASGVDWIESVRGNADSVCIIQGNFFGAAGSTRNYLRLLTGPFLVIGNTFNGTGSVYSDSDAPITSVGNMIASSANSLSTATLTDFHSIGDTVTFSRTYHRGALQFQRTTSALATSDQGQGNRALIIGHNNTGTPGESGIPLIYNNAAVANGNLVLQSGNDANARQVVLRAGTGPSDNLIVSGTGVGFNGTSPVAKPTVTGSRASGAALTSLLTALASQGLITDSSSA